MTWPPCWQTPPADLRLKSGEAHVWLGALDVSPERLQELRTILNVDEVARADRFLQAHDRIHSAAARGHLRMLLGRYLCVAPKSIELQFNSYGKPSLAGEFAAGDLRFNVSHSHGLALFAFTRGRELGVDLEKIRPNFATTEIAGRFFSAAESGRLRSLAPEQRPRAFFECWTRKEAYIKARGDGLSRRLDTFEVAFGPDLTPAILAAADEPDAAVRWAVHDLHPPDGYCGALMVEKPDLAVTCWMLD
jgi:4'-phosphopantetheinyl transferase